MSLKEQEDEIQQEKNKKIYQLDLEEGGGNINQTQTLSQVQCSYRNQNIQKNTLKKTKKTKSIKNNYQIKIYDNVPNINTQDSLLYYYFVKKITEYQLIYIRFDNIDKFMLKNNIKYMGGYFTKSFKDAYQKLIMDLPILSNSQQQLKFDSKFEGGNLFAAIKIQQYQYDLILQNDINTKGNLQWFYFKVMKLKKFIRYKFNIVNFVILSYQIKSNSLFKEGLQPCFYSQVEKKWVRDGFNISYRQSQLQRQGLLQNKYYCLSFYYIPKHQNDTISIIHSYPYSFSKLKLFIESLKTNNSLRVKIIGKSTCLNNIYALQIGNRSAKKAIIIMARQHPGQTPGSYVMQGIVEYLCQNDNIVTELKQRYLFVLIPMINPDGVILGNYRSNFFGLDLNRRWRSPNIFFEVQVFQVKKYMVQISKNYEILMILDLHGHSKKLNSFFYGNPCERGKNRLYPYLANKINPHISFDQSTFSINQSKICTARVQLMYTLKCNNVYTFECSFFGYVDKNYQKKHFTIQDFNNLGKGLIISVFQLENVEKKRIKLNVLNQNKQSLNQGSDSEPEKDQLQNSQKPFYLISKQNIKSESDEVRIRKQKGFSQKHKYRIKQKHRYKKCNQTQLAIQSKQFNEKATIDQNFFMTQKILFNQENYIKDNAIMLMINRFKKRIKLYKEDKEQKNVAKSKLNFISLPSFRILSATLLKTSKLKHKPTFLYKNIQK